MPEKGPYILSSRRRLLLDFLLSMIAFLAVAGFETRFSIDRLDYGVGTGKFFEMGVVGNKVDILITLELLKD